MARWKRLAAAICIGSITALAADYDRASQGVHRTDLDYDGQFT